LKKPYWIKLNSGEHKRKQGAVKRAGNLQEVKEKLRELKKKFKNSKFVVQEDIKGQEIIAGMKKDKTFGKVLLIGSGGNLAETIKDIEFRVLPIDKSEVREAIEELEIYPVLKENDCSIKKLVKVIHKFSKLAKKSEWEQADLNPIIVNDKEAKVVDARISL
jgi:succinyl-CoA synthetase beta subunit